MIVAVFLGSVALATAAVTFAAISHPGALQHKPSWGQMILMITAESVGIVLGSAMILEFLTRLVLNLWCLPWEPGRSRAKHNQFVEQIARDDSIPRATAWASANIMLARLILPLFGTLGVLILIVILTDS